MKRKRVESPPIGDSRIRCVVFDAVGTLIQAEPSVDAAYQQVGARYGSKLTREQISSRFKAAFQTSEATDLDDEQRLVTSERIERDRWKQIVATVLDDATDSDACLADLWDHFGSPAAWSCYDDVRHTFERLRSADIEIAIASNFDARLNAVCDGHPELAVIANRVISSEVGFRKPSDQFFEAVLNQTNCAACEILFVGDDVLNDVAGPRAAGMNAVHLRRHESATDSIRRLTDVVEFVACFNADFPTPTA